MNTTHSTNNQQFDIIIVGAGIVGLSLAMALASTELRIAIIDKESAPDTTILSESYDSRVSTINHAAQAFFQTYQVWELLKQSRVSAYQEMEVWDANSTAKIHFACSELAQSHLGHIIEHNVLKNVLWQHLQLQSNIHLFPKTELAALIENPDQSILKLKTGEELQAKLVVGADGAHSWLAKAAGITIKTKPYQQSAVITTVRTELPHQYTAWQRFLTTGPLAFLPLTDPHLCSIVWSTSPEHAQTLQNMPTKDFNLALCNGIENRLGAVETLDKSVIFPLVERHAEHYVKPRIALIGDAAHTIHPLAGQGLNMGLMDAACLAQVLQKAAENQRDIGSISTLRRYERWRKGENQIMISAMAEFKRLFANTSPVATYARGLGVSLTDKLPWLKNHFMRRAMGLTGDLPKSAMFID